jgi:SAM-dependent methyltransferase
MKDEGKISGEYTTPPQVVDFMIGLIKPQLGETIYDPACGTGSFLTAAHKYIESKEKPRDKDSQSQLRDSFYGRDINAEVLEVARQRFLADGINPQHLQMGDSLRDTKNTTTFPAQFDVVLTNPPFGSTRNPQTYKNSQYRSRYLEVLFLHHAIDSLKPNGRCAILLPDAMWTRSGHAVEEVKARLVQECTIKGICNYEAKVYLDVVAGFNVLVFTKGGPTEKIKFLDVDENTVSHTVQTLTSHEFQTEPNLSLNFLSGLHKRLRKQQRKKSEHKIFVSYRRIDTSWAAGRLCDYLRTQFHENHIFHDIDSITIGQDFVEIIEKALISCEVVLVIIGRNWVREIKKRANEEDWVRKEIATAINLERTIIPVLIDGAKMPSISDLPSEIADMARINAMKISAEDFVDKMKKLVDTIKNVYLNEGKSTA